MSKVDAAELTDTFFDALAADPEAERLPGMAAVDARLVRSIVLLEHVANELDARTAARMWSRVLESSQPMPALNGSRAWALPDSMAHAAPNYGVRFVERRTWLARAAAVVLLVFLGGTAFLGISPDAQAQVRRLACLVPNLGVRACDTPGLVSMQPVSVTSNGLTVQVLGLQASSDATLVRVRISDLPVPGISGPVQPSEKDLLLVAQGIQSLQLQARDSRGQVATPVASGGQALPGTPSNTPRAAQVLYFWMQPGADGVWHLAVTAEWTFGPLSPNAQSVDVLVPSPPGPVTVTVPLVPVQAAGLPVLGMEGAEVVEHGVGLRITGVTRTTSGLTLQVTARSPASNQRIVGLGTLETGQASPVLGRVLWDNEGHLHAEVSTGGLAETRSEGGSYFQTLTFPSLSPDVVASTLEIPSVRLLDETASASLTIPVGGRQVGDQIAMDTTVAFGPYPLHIVGASILAADDGRELLVDLDQVDVNDDRVLLGPQTIQVVGRDELRPSLTWDVVDKRHKQLHVPLPSDIGPDVTLTFSGAGMELPGPWRLPVPSAG